jgi:hypothetical protein
MSMAGGWRSNAYRAPRFSKNPGWRGAFAPLFEASFGIRKLPRSLALGLCLGAGRLIALTAEFPQTRADRRKILGSAGLGHNPS